MPERVVLISIQPKWVQEILAGRKTIELRKRIAKLAWPARGLIYESSPACRVRAWCVLGPAISDNPLRLWDKVKERACVPRDFYNAYFKGKAIAYGLSVSDVRELRSPISLDRLRREVGMSQPPVDYCWAPDILIRLAEDY